MKLAISALVAISSCAYGYSQSLIHLESELKRVGSHSALILPSNAIDEYPLWSAAGDFLGLNVEGKWIKVDLGKIKLEGAKWRGNQIIGVNTAKESVSLADSTEIRLWQQRTKMFPREIVLSNGTKVELKEADMGVALLVTPKDSKPETIWQTGLENCHSLTASPNGQFVAFLSELSGAVIMKIAK